MASVSALLLPAARVDVGAAADQQLDRRGGTVQGEATINGVTAPSSGAVVGVRTLVDQLLGDVGVAEVGRVEQRRDGPRNPAPGRRWDSAPAASKRSTSGRSFCRTARISCSSGVGAGPQPASSATSPARIRRGSEADRASPDISPGHARIACRSSTRQGFQRCVLRGTLWFRGYAVSGASPATTINPRPDEISGLDQLLPFLGRLPQRGFGRAPRRPAQNRSRCRSGVAESVVDGGEALDVVADVDAVRHAHAAVQAESPAG